ncbi:MAG: hypothetical protein IJI37_04050, partial [Opitutales bacterium]|nr:hypothetical protein [Opitutales bacterium]
MRFAKFAVFALASFAPALAFAAGEPAAGHCRMNVMSFNMLYLSDKPESSESHAVSVKVWPIRKDML